ncbi:hypothetical protein ACFORH_43430 [Amycolatopsis roodepoortensis]|uniref:Uncharacterized protein n=1 Tax=Amycolatopsis roodepoortensis TaxID=700274 RepID=A0ABR9LJE7_9PSEU|nr:hypothetical protein [Amycolatopsis roodepoortensis]MBE1580405.1 hypothetical protein [Amycolatopsis roodepoortensis]
MTHSLRTYHRVDEQGVQWIGVNVCSKQCDGPRSDRHPGRTFSVDEDCRHCGAPGELEWRLNNW